MSSDNETLYHVTDDGEVKRCTATKRPCRYLSREGNRHFTDREEALQAGNDLLDKQYTLIDSHSKGNNTQVKLDKIARNIEDKVSDEAFLGKLAERDELLARIDELKEGFDERKATNVEIREQNLALRDLNEDLEITNQWLNQYRAETAALALQYSELRDRQEQDNGVFLSYDDDTLGGLRSIGEYESNSPEWNALRDSSIGGSDVGKIMKVDKDYAYQGYSEVMNTKLGLPVFRYNNDDPSELTSAIGRGNAWENYIKQKYADNHPELNVAYCKSTWEDPEHPYRHANFDGLLLDDDGNANGILEIKTGRRSDKWGNEEDGLDGVPPGYKAQVLWYAKNAGLTHGTLVAVLDDHDYREYNFKMDDPGISEYCDNMMQETDKFWADIEDKKQRLANGEDLFPKNSGFPKRVNKKQLAAVYAAYTTMSEADAYAKVNEHFAKLGKPLTKLSPEEVQETCTSLFTSTPPSVRKQDLIGIDLETTSLTAKKGRIIETGISSLSPDGKVTELYSSLHGIPEKSRQAYSVGVTEVHRITEDMIANKDTFDSPEVSSKILGLVKGKTLVAHNAGFEKQFLTTNLPGFAEMLDSGEVRFLDTKYLSKTLMPNSEGNRLMNFSELNGVPYVNAHAALADTNIMLKALHNFQNNLFDNKGFVEGSSTPEARRAAELEAEQFNKRR